MATTTNFIHIYEVDALGSLNQKIKSLGGDPGKPGNNRRVKLPITEEALSLVGFIIRDYCSGRSVPIYLNPNPHNECSSSYTHVLRASRDYKEYLSYENIMGQVRKHIDTHNSKLAAAEARRLEELKVIAAENVARRKDALQTCKEVLQGINLQNLIHDLEAELQGGAEVKLSIADLQTLSQKLNLWKVD